MKCNYQVKKKNKKRAPIYESLSHFASLHAAPPNTAPVVSDSGSVEPGNRRPARGGPRGRTVSAADSDSLELLGREGAGEREGRGGWRGVPDPRPRTVLLPPRARARSLPIDRHSPRGAVEGEVTGRLPAAPPWAPAGERPGFAEGAVWTPAPPPRQIAGWQSPPAPPPGRSNPPPPPLTPSPFLSVGLRDSGEGAGGRHTGPTPLQRSPGTRAGGEGTRRGRGAGAAIERRRRRRRRRQ